MSDDRKRFGRYGSASVVILAEGRLVLGVTRGTNLAALGLPGGGVHVDDASLQHAAARELLEETGVRVDPSALVYLSENRGRDGDHVTFLAPKVESWPDELRSDPFEGYVGLWQPEAFLTPASPFRDYLRRLFVQLGIV